MQRHTTRTRMTSFKAIRARAAKRKGGAAALAALLPAAPDNARVASVADDRVLAEMARRVFCAGFVWRVIEQKWPGFEDAFLGFRPKVLVARPDEFWEALAADRRIVRNGQKIISVRRNAAFVLDLAAEHGSAGKMLAAWPANDQAGLLDLLAKRGDRLGGASGQMLLRSLGWDAFMTSRDVVACLRDAGVDVAEQVTSKRDMAKVQAQFNAWAAETGLAYTVLSRICALSIEENRPAEELGHRGRED
jgi:3-methyladenine DNA glycosylase Tag